MSSRNLQSGLTLPETLAAIVAVAVVLLSVVTVHLERARAAPGIALREEAQRLAQELATTIRNSRGTGVHFEDAVGVVCSKALMAKASQTAANNDIACWQDSVSEQLPNGEGAIMTDADSIPAAYVIVVSWSQPGARGASYLLRVTKDVTKDVSAPSEANKPDANKVDATKVSPSPAVRAAN